MTKTVPSRLGVRSGDDREHDMPKESDGKGYG